VSPALAFLGVSILGTWGLASIGMIAGGIILIIDPGQQQTASEAWLGGLALIGAGVISGGIMQVVVMPLLPILDPPFPIKAKSIVPQSKLTRWSKAGALRDFKDGQPKEVSILTKHVVIVRDGDTAYALRGSCSHARLPLGGLPGITPEPMKDGCITCPFHGARFEVATGKVVRQPFDSVFNNEHPLLGRVQSKLFKVISSPPAPSFVPKPSMKAEDTQTYPVKIENGNVMVGLPK